MRSLIHYGKKYFFLFLFHTAAWAEIPGLFEDSGVIPVDEAFSFSHQVTDNQIVLRWDIAETCYLYRDRVKITTTDEGAELSAWEFPPGEEKDDPNFGLVEVYHDSLSLRADYASAREFSLLVSYQGCDEATGICYTPTKKTITIPASQAGSGSAGGSASEVDQFLDTLTNEESWLIGIALFLLAGLLLGLTPCVYPMIPVLASMLSVEEKGRGGNLPVTLFYVLGISVMFAMLGVLSASVGSSLTNFFQQWQFLLPGAIIITLFALSLFGLFTVSLPFARQHKSADGRH